MHLVCPKCLATNRVPPERLGEGPVCGRCGQPLRESHPISLADAALTRFIERHEPPIVVDFWAPWCGPCRTMAPQFEAAARQLPEVTFAKVNTDEHPASGSRLGIRSIPTLVLWHGGRERARRSGASSATDLVRWIQAQLS